MPESPVSTAGRGRETWLWVALVTVASLALSRAFACAMPFAAMAAYAACNLPRRHAVALVVATWLGNQAVGFGLLHYPHTASTFGWGLAIGAAALAALSVARAAGTSPMPKGLAGAVVAFAMAYGAYEVALAVAALLLPSGPGAFAWPVMLRVASIHAVAFGLLLCIDRLARVMGMPLSGKAMVVAS